MALSSPSPSGLIAISVIFLILSILALSGRLWSRRRDRVPFGADDYLALAALISFIVFLTIPVMIGAADAGLGTHTQRLPSGRPKLPSKTFNNIQFLFLTFHVFTLGLARCSILFLYRRIFVGKRFSILCWGLVAYTIAWTMSFFLAFLLRCIPVTTATLPPPGSKCIDLVPTTQALGITSALSDFLILLVPWPFVWKLQMRKTQKFGVGIIFLLGNLTLAFSIVRCVMLFEIGDEILKGIPDFPYFDGITIVWAELESSMAIICSCLPALGRYVRHGLPAGLQQLTSRIRLLYSSASRRREGYRRDRSDGGSISLENLNKGARGLRSNGHAGRNATAGEQARNQIGVRRDIYTETEPNRTTS